MKKSILLVLVITLFTSCSDPAESKAEAPINQTSETSQEMGSLEHDEANQLERLEAMKEQTQPESQPEKVETSTVKSGDPINWLLPGGRTIQIYKDGLEEKLLKLLEGKSDSNEKHFVFDRISFKTGSAELSENSYSQLKLIAKIMSAFRDHVYLLRGHTDNRGSNKLNRTLSYKRANSLKQFFLDYGVPRHIVRTQGLGEQEPIATNDTAEGRAKNRRIDISITK